MKQNERVALVNPPLDEGCEPCIDSGYWQPLNLLALASHLKANAFRGELAIFDREVATREAIEAGLDNFNPTIVGLSPNISSYQTAKEIAHTQKERGARVIFGGNYATSLSEQIIKCAEDVDGVVVHDGEIAFEKIVRGCDDTDVPNFVFRAPDGQIRKTTVSHAQTASVTAIDYGLVDLESYFRNYSGSSFPGSFQRPLTVLTQRGCVWRDRSGGCVFCSRMEPQFVSDPPQSVWERLEENRDRHGIDAIVDVGDDFIGHAQWFADFCASRPGTMQDIGIRFIYSRTNNITPQNADRLAAFRTQEVFLGLESGDPTILKHTVKGNHPNNHLKALRLLKDRNISAIAAFVLGLPGETRASLRKTEEHITRAMDTGAVSELVIAPMTPLPLAPAYDELMKIQGLRERYGCSDALDLKGLQAEWFKRFCDVSLKEVYDTIARVKDRYRNTSFDFGAQ